MGAEKPGAAAPQTYRILILPEQIEAFAAAGTPLLDVLRAHVAMDAPCGGNHTCGKCAVDVTVCGKTARVRACQTRVDSDMTVLHTPAADAQGLARGSADPESVAHCAVPNMCHSDAPLAAAFDIGTTTLVCSLLDPASGRELAVRGARNPQTAYGADVMTRLHFAAEHGPRAMQNAVVSGMNALLAENCAAAGVSPTRVVHLTAAGNSAMQTLLLGRSPAPLTRPPYRPESCDAVTVDAAALGLSASAGTQLTYLPLIGGFVGADTTACLLATDFDALTGTTLLVDIGTNGELVLGNGSRRIACSTAAGPAFEGAQMHSGMRAATGAIDRVELVGDALRCSVAGSGAPRGICGGGYIFLAACLLAAGALEESGRLLRRGPLGGRVTDHDGQAAFTVVSAEETASGEPILFTQKDVRALQLAKGAIAAGIACLIETLGIPIGGVDRLLLAGAFGHALDVPGACAIGLLPEELAPRTRSVGNAAIEGAKRVARDPNALTKATALARGTEHVALAAASDFQERYLDALALRPMRL